MPEKHRRIVWTQAARKDLRGIWQYYARVASPEIADQMLREIAETSERLTDRALMGRARDEVAPGLRSILRPPYVIFYRVTKDSIEIARVLHGRRNLAAVFKKEH
jgi:toxin ParE1/3/4